MSNALLTSEDARAKRDQLLEDGYCVVPGVLRGEALERIQAYSDEFLDTHPAPERYRFQGTDFTIMNEVEVNRYLSGKAQYRPDRPLHFSPMTDELLANERQAQTCADLGLEGMHHTNNFIILSKPAHGPALYWHQDNMEWNHPKSGLPWPTMIFLSYYMVDTTRHNGCLRVIPGTHRKRIEFHDLLPDAHEDELQAPETTEDHPAFSDHPDAVDLSVAAGDLVIADSRILHAAWPNQSEQRRTLILQWWSVFPFPSMPTWWEGEIPPELSFDPAAHYEGTRTPTAYLKS